MGIADGTDINGDYYTNFIYEDIINKNGLYVGITFYKCDL